MMASPSSDVEAAKLPEDVLPTEMQVFQYYLYLKKVNTAQWAKSGFFVQWVYWVYLSSQNTRPLCNAAMYEQV